MYIIYTYALVKVYYTVDSIVLQYLKYKVDASRGYLKAEGLAILIAHNLTTINAATMNLSRFTNLVVLSMNRSWPILFCKLSIHGMLEGITVNYTIYTVQHVQVLYN